LVAGDGRTIDDYVDGHAILGDPTGLAGCCELICERLQRLDAIAVAGEVTAACGLVAGVVLRSRQRGASLAGRFLRKEAKGYGVRGLLNTELPPRSRIVVLDDVTGVGDSAARVVGALRDEGHEVGSAIVVLDRGEGAAERLAELGVELSWLFDLSEASGPARAPVGTRVRGG
jgi:orotate phosphoribosyltransferase